MKYIIFENDGLPCPVIFSKTVTHSDMANKVKGLGKPISAGFVSGELTAWGESSSLNLKSRKQDTQLIQFLMLM